MKRTALFALLIAVVGVSQSAVGRPQEIRYPCYWVYGRLQLYNGGSPNFRIWPKGTKRLLGVSYAGEKWVDDWDRLPPEIQKLNPIFGRIVWGEFKVCPLSNERAGWMRFVELSAGRKLTVIDYRK